VPCRHGIALRRSVEGVSWECRGSVVGVSWECRGSVAGVSWECLAVHVYGVHVYGVHEGAGSV